jgi:DNA processing protein
MPINQFSLALSTFTKFGPARLTLLHSHFDSPQHIWEASKSQLVETGLSEKLVESYLAHRNKIDPDRYLESVQKRKISFTSQFDEDYPQKLKDIRGAPFYLYYKGMYAQSDLNAIAIVGSRKMTSYGKEVAETFSKVLAAAGITIISGLARGVDTIAHSGSLAVHGRTLAVIACGLDQIYPASNTQLAQRIIESGAIFSEYPLGYPALRENFGARNRIISGLSRGVLIVEGEHKSGTLLTATHAGEQGRQVYAVPGSIFTPLSEAPHFLIQNGAQLVTKPSDILSDIGNVMPSSDRIPPAPLDETEATIVTTLSQGPISIDEIVRVSGLTVATISAKLTVMELKGYVKNMGGGVYRKI